jgi:cardiolipin synthase
LLHAKTVVIDGVWSTVGSTNMDMRSFLHNRELNVVVLGNDFGTEMEKLFAHDVEKSIAVTRESWKKRSPLARLRQWAASMFSYWL